MQHINNSYFISCPHCQTTIEILDDQINCQIFRCGVYKTPHLSPINPHSSEIECRRLIDDNLIWGCGQPFRFDGQNVNQCDYI